MTCGDQVISFKLGQYHGCWCPGSIRRQDISSRDIDYIEYTGPSLTWGRILSTCVKSMWRNDIKCKYMFMFPLKNFARKGSRNIMGIYVIIQTLNVLPCLFQWCCLALAACGGSWSLVPSGTPPGPIHSEMTIYLHSPDDQTPSSLISTSMLPKIATVIPTSCSSTTPPFVADIIQFFSYSWCAHT